MITIISGTNRRNSKTKDVAKQYVEIFKSHTDEPVELIALDEIDSNILTENMYVADGQSKALAEIQEKYMLPAKKYFVLTPEYNGSFAGILKLFIDAVSINKYKETFSGKKVGLAGVASGRAGGLRALDHLSGIFNHVGSIVLPNKLPISQVGNISTDNVITDEGIVGAMENQVKAFINF